VNDLMAKKKSPTPAATLPAVDDSGLLGRVVSLLISTRHTAARAVNAVMTVTDGEIGRRIVAVEQQGSAPAAYGDESIKRLAADGSARTGVFVAECLPEAGFPLGLSKHFADGVCKICDARLRRMLRLLGPSRHSFC